MTYLNTYLPQKNVAPWILSFVYKVNCAISKIKKHNLVSKPIIKKTEEDRILAKVIKNSAIVFNHTNFEKHTVNKTYIIQFLNHDVAITQ
jgi:hypothetical protein